MVTGSSSAPGDRAAWEIGGHDTPLTPIDQLEQLASHLDAHYPAPDFTPPWAGGTGDATQADNYCAKLPDRVTSASMVLLGAGLDHSMPGVAFTEGITVTHPAADLAEFIASDLCRPDTWVISLHPGGWWRGSAQALEMQWRPEVAAVANLAGCHALDVDYPLAPEHSVTDMLAAIRRAIAHAQRHGAQHIHLWGYSSGAALATVAAAAATPADAISSLILTHPDFDSLTNLPSELCPDSIPAGSWPRTLLQLATHDEVAPSAHARTVAATNTAHPSTLHVIEYVSHHRICTPEVARQRIRDVAAFITHS
ncbi:MAG: alpha/beta hydrolase fold domain-containing protein [Corynebacterium sp.]|nr:alpha/beta hydrolase fold domain-containing protein [Corynebacterium sp.]